MLLSVKEAGSTWVSFIIPEDKLLTHRPIINSSIQEGWNGARCLVVEVEMEEIPVTSHPHRFNVFDSSERNPNGY